VVERVVVPDERKGKNTGKRDGQLEMSPVANEERQQGEEHPRRCPEQFQGGSSKRAINGRK